MPTTSDQGQVQAVANGAQNAGVVTKLLTAAGAVSGSASAVGILGGGREWAALARDLGLKTTAVIFGMLAVTMFLRWCATHLVVPLVTTHVRYVNKSEQQGERLTLANERQAGSIERLETTVTGLARGQSEIKQELLTQARAQTELRADFVNHTARIENAVERLISGATPNPPPKKNT